MSGAGRVTAGLPASLLLVEDDDALRQMLAWELAELGYLVHPAGDCREARDAVAERAFDVALLDVGLPDGDGAELAAELIQRSPELRVVLCSGRPGNLSPDRIPAEVIAGLTKPISVAELDDLFRSGHRPGAQV
jgi:DNA-binding response OmpR family regulator